jgi:hypothetical protein
VSTNVSERSSFTTDSRNPPPYGANTRYKIFVYLHSQGTNDYKQEDDGNKQSEQDEQGEAMHNEGRGVALVFRQRRRGDDGRTTFERRELLDLAQNEDKAHHPLVIQRRPMKKGHAQRFLFAVTLLLALSACTTTAVASADEEECGVWFAPSTIPGAGFGIFAGQNYDAGSIILSGELSVPIHDLAWNNGDGDGAEGKPPNLWDDYHWNADA